MTGALLAGVLAGLAVAMPIGAIGGYLVGLAARERTATAVAAGLGVASVDGAYALLAGLGGNGVAALVGRVAGPLSVVAAVVLVAVAVRTWLLAYRRYRSTTDSLAAPPSGLTPRRAYVTLVALTAVNPATVITFAAVVLGQSATGATVTGPAGVALFAGGALAASAAWQLLLVAGGSGLGRVLRGARGQLAIAGCSAALMLGLAAATVLT